MRFEDCLKQKVIGRRGCVLLFRERLFLRVADEIMTLGRFLGSRYARLRCTQMPELPEWLHSDQLCIIIQSCFPGKTQDLLLLPKSYGVCASWLGGFGFSPNTENMLFPIHRDTFQKCRCFPQLLKVPSEEVNPQHPLCLICWQVYQERGQETMAGNRKGVCGECHSRGGQDTIGKRSQAMLLPSLSSNISQGPEWGEGL